MITNKDMDKILEDVNRVFSNYEERLKKLTARVDELEGTSKATSSTTTKKTSQEKTS